MPKVGKIVVAVVVAIVGLSAMGMVLLRDLGQRPEFCGTCHAMKPYVDSWTSSDYLAAKHQAAGVSCQQCHPQTMGGQVSELVSTVTNNYKQPLAEIRFSKATCQNCHGDYAHLAELTKDNPVRNPHKSHLGELDCRTCHKAHKVSIDYCAQCHPGATVTGPGWKAPNQ